MRVIAGQYRGRTLVAPSGNATRPTTDRVRESLFSTITSLRGGFDEAIVLDAFAGTGALGIEALSRGAAYAVFCERDRFALAALQRNTSFLDPEMFSVVKGDVLNRSLATPAPFDMLFFDPPYAADATAVSQVLERLDQAGQLDREALVSYEHAATLVSPLLELASPLEWQLEVVKTYGDTAIDLYRRA